MKNIRKILFSGGIFVLLQITFYGKMYSQVDPHFSQYYLQPMALNPALTGVIDGDFRVSGIWRSQYGNELLTKGLSAEFVSNKNANFGLNIINSSSKDGAYNYTSAYANMAYNGIRFGKNGNQFLVLGMQYGFMTRRFNTDKLQFGSQWISGTGYNTNSNSNETSIRPSVSVFDAGVGIAFYDAAPDQLINVFAGVGALHITRPANPFLGKGTLARVPVRYCAQAGARIYLSDLISVVPSFIMLKQGHATEKMAGAYAQFNVTDKIDWIAGANWRIRDAVVPFTGLYAKGFTIGISYDVNTSQASIASGRSNTIELSLSYVWSRKGNLKTTPFYCPRF